MMAAINGVPSVSSRAICLELWSSDEMGCEIDCRTLSARGRKTSVLTKGPASHGQNPLAETVPEVPTQVGP